MKALGIIVGIVLVAAVIVVVIPAPDPLQGVETIAIESGEPSIPTDVVEELEIALNNRKVRLISDPSQADARITGIKFDAGDLSLSLDSDGVSGTAHIVCEIEKDGERIIMDLYVSYVNEEVNATLVGRKFYEFWK